MAATAQQLLASFHCDAARRARRLLDSGTAPGHHNSTLGEVQGDASVGGPERYAADANARPACVFDRRGSLVKPGTRVFVDRCLSSAAPEEAV